ncbi:MAG: FixH family protein [Rhizobiaceae bacterium]|nr:FixH family protein [Rhizobiaceae bacterium]
MSGPFSSERRDLWIPACFVLFFIALAVMQGAFVYTAQSTFSGLVTDQTMRRAGNGPAWTADIALVDAGSLSGRLTLTISDERRLPLAPDRLEATIERGSKFPQSLPLVLTPVAPGKWEAPVDVPMAGPWTVRIMASSNNASFEAISVVEIAP